MQTVVTAMETVVMAITGLMDLNQVSIFRVVFAKGADCPSGRTERQFG